MKLAFDIEASGLLDETTLEYPEFKLKPTFKVHCVVFQDIDTKKIYKYYKDNLHDCVELLKKATMLIGHNIISYDLPVLKLFFGVDYDVYPDKVLGNDVEIIDTLLMSKLLNPDRQGGHSLKLWGKRLGFNKGTYGEVDDDEVDVWEEFNEEMLEYCVRDVELTTKVYRYLVEQEGFYNWNWKEAYELEKAVREIITRQEHVGFWFDKEKAEKHHETLSKWMKEIEDRVEPQLPVKPITKTAAKDFIPPVRQFKKDGTAAADLGKFAAKHNGTLECSEEGKPVKMVLPFGTYTEFPLPREPLVTEEPMKLSDQKWIKQHLIDLGWEPTEWGERDLTIDSKKRRLSKEKIIAAIDRYIDECRESSFARFRMEFWECKTVDELDKKLKESNFNRSIKVRTSPKFTVGLEKEIDPTLDKVDGADYGQDIADWLTYRHRKNAIKSDKGTGFLNTMRKDGRINTPADTLGAVTSRFKHRNVANIPRPTSKFGKEMRELFGVGSDMIQVGADADSLEAKVEGHYCYKYSGGVDYSKALVAAKPNDIHSVNAKKMGVIRDHAKSVKYGCLPVENTEVLTASGWKMFNDIVEGEEILSYNVDDGCIEKDRVLETFFYQDAEVVVKTGKSYQIESTPDHRWYGWQRRTKGSGKNQTRYKEWKFFTTEEMTSEHNIHMAGKLANKEENPNLSVSEAGFLGWILSDGYYKWSDLGEGTSCSYGNRKGIIGMISQSQNKYWREVEDTLRDAKVEWNKVTTEQDNGNSTHGYHLRSAPLREFLDRVVPGRKQKHEEDWVKLILSFGPKQLDSFFHCFWLADGHSDKRSSDTKIITQNEGTICDAVELAGALLGYRVTRKIHTDGEKKCMSIRYSEKPHLTNQNLINTEETKDVFCLSTLNETFIIRQNGAIMVTGNCSYGANWPKLKKMLGVGDKEAKKIFNDFWEAAKPLAQLKERATKYWETTGNKAFILGLDGRKLWVRSPHAILNTLFQSAGVICMKRAMVIWDRWVRDRGWDSVQQMIAYHN